MSSLRARKVAEVIFGDTAPAVRRTYMVLRTRKHPTTGALMSAPTGPYVGKRAPVSGTTNVAARAALIADAEEKIDLDAGASPELVIGGILLEVETGVSWTVVYVQRFDGRRAEVYVKSQKPKGKP